MPRGIIYIKNETWKISATINAKRRSEIAKELDKLHDALRRLEPLAAGGATSEAKFLLGEFGDMLLDSDIRYGEVM